MYTNNFTHDILWKFYMYTTLVGSIFLEKSNNEELKIRSRPPEVLFYKCVLPIRSKFTGEHPRWNAMCFLSNLLHILRTHFSRNIAGELLLLNFVELMKAQNSCHSVIYSSKILNYWKSIGSFVLNSEL